MLQNAIVFLIVSIAALYALWRWLPLAWRHSTARRLADQALKAGLINARRASQFAGALDQSSSASCGACRQCGGCSGNTRDPLP